MDSRSVNFSVLFGVATAGTLIGFAMAGALTLLIAIVIVIIGGLASAVAADYEPLEDE